MHNPLIAYLERHPDGRLVNRWRHYFDIYHRHFAGYRGQRLTVIEIGVFNGGSLRMWRDYFGPQATVVGVDVNPDCRKYAEPGIDIVIGDQSDRIFLRALADRYADLAILIDDGGHRMQQQIATFEELYPRLRPDGVYVCEDTHTSYVPTFGGGYKQSQTFIEAAKALVDRLHAFHSIDHAQWAPDDFTRSTDSIHFYDSVVVIEKMPRQEPQDVAYGTSIDCKYIAPSLSGTVDQALQRAVTLHRAGQLQEADVIYRSIIEAQPQHADANHNLGILALGMQQTRMALGLLRTALEANPAQGQYWLSYIEALLAAGDGAAARSILSQGKQQGLAGAAVDALQQRVDKI